MAPFVSLEEQLRTEITAYKPVKITDAEEQLRAWLQQLGAGIASVDDLAVLQRWREVHAALLAKHGELRAVRDALLDARGLLQNVGVVTTMAIQVPEIAGVTRTLEEQGKTLEEKIHAAQERARLAEVARVEALAREEREREYDAGLAGFVECVFVYPDGKGLRTAITAHAGTLVPDPKELAAPLVDEFLGGGMAATHPLHGEFQKIQDTPPVAFVMSVDLKEKFVALEALESGGVTVDPAVRTGLEGQLADERSAYDRAVAVALRNALLEKAEAYFADEQKKTAPGAYNQRLKVEYAESDAKKAEIEALLLHDLQTVATVLARDFLETGAHHDGVVEMAKKRCMYRINSYETDIYIKNVLDALCSKNLGACTIHTPQPQPQQFHGRDVSVADIQPGVRALGLWDALVHAVRQEGRGRIKDVLKTESEKLAHYVDKASRVINSLTALPVDRDRVRVEVKCTFDPLKVEGFLVFAALIQTVLGSDTNSISKQECVE